MDPYKDEILTQLATIAADVSKNKYHAIAAILGCVCGAISENNEEKLMQYLEPFVDERLKAIKEIQNNPIN